MGQIPLPQWSHSRDLETEVARLRAALAAAQPSSDVYATPHVRVVFGAFHSILSSDFSAKLHPPYRSSAHENYCKPCCVSPYISGVDTQILLNMTPFNPVTCYRQPIHQLPKAPFPTTAPVSRDSRKGFRASEDFYQRPNEPMEECVILMSDSPESLRRDAMILDESPRVLVDESATSGLVIVQIKPGVFRCSQGCQTDNVLQPLATPRMASVTPSAHKATMVREYGYTMKT